MSEEIIRNLDAIDVTMGGGSTVLNVVLAFVMFGVALGIKPRTFIDILKSPKSIILGIVCQLLLLPALTLLLVMVMGDWISPMIALGMILVAACPGGNISNFITSLSRGNVELSVSLTAFNTALCVFSTPINFAIWGNLYLKYAAKQDIILPELQIPFWEIFQSIVIIMGIPLVLGILCSQYLPNVAKKLNKPLQSLSIVVFVVMVVGIFASNFDAFMKCIQYIFLVVLLHNLLALGIGFSTSTLLKVLGLILLLNPNIFPADGAWANNGGMLVITAWWGVWHIISGLTLAYAWRIRGRKEPNED